MYHEIKGKSHPPEFKEGLTWFNTPHPLKLRELKGKIVILDFFTYCCINCMHVLSDLKKLEKKYSNLLVVIGVHSPKFENEKVDEHVREAVLRYQIEHPVICDPNLTQWRQFGVRAWPTLALIDPEGYAVGLIPGEGNFEAIDEIVSEMIEEYRAKGLLNEIPLSFEPEKTPETHLLFPGKLIAPTDFSHLILSDSNHHRILIVEENGRVKQIIGSGKAGQEDGDFSKASFQNPQGIFQMENTLFVADTDNHMIRGVHLKDRKVSTVAGMGVQARYSGESGFGPEVALRSPWDLAFVEPDLFIAMAGSHQIWAYQLFTGDVRPFAGSGREGRVDGALASAAFAQPSGLTTDGKNIYVADSEVSSIRTISLKTGQVETLAGEDLFEFGDQDGIGPEVRLQHCLGVACDEGLIYIADTYNHKIKKLDPQTRECRTLAGTGKPGRATGKNPEFYEPGGLSVRGDWIYVADTNNHRIMKVHKKTGEGEEVDLKF